MTNSRRITLFLGILTLVFCVLLVRNWLPWLRGDVPWLPGDSAWRWPYAPPRWFWLIPSILGVMAYTVGAMYLLERDQTDRYPTKLILWVFVGAALLPLLLMTLEGRPLFLLFTVSASPLTGGYQLAATQVTDLNYALRHWPDFLVQYQRGDLPPSGIALSPPGLIAGYYGVAKFFEAVPFLAQTFGGLTRPLECQKLAMMTWSDAQFASAWPQMFMPLWAALSVAPLYRLGTYIADHAVARRAVLLWPLIPGLVMFNPRFNTFFALLALVMLVALWRGIAFNRQRWTLVAGFIMSAATFINLSLVPLGLLAGLLLLGQWALSGIRRDRLRTLARNLILYGIGTASVWIIYTGLSGISIIDIYRLSLNLHFNLDRPYFPWLFMHTYDTYLFIGVPIAILAIARIFIARKMTPMNVFAVASGLTLLIMVLSGTARGETGRVWLFFAPCWILLAADLIGKFDVPHRKIILVLEAACLICMAAVLRVNFTELTPPRTVPSADQAATFSINAQFVQGKDRLTLVGLSLDRLPHEVRLYLHWRADTSISRPYTFSLVRVPPDKAPMDSYTWQPLGWDNPYAPSCWLPGQEFVDVESVSLGDESKPGDWQFSLSITDVYTHEGMKVIYPDGQTSTQVGIGPVNIPAQ